MADETAKKPLISVAMSIFNNSEAEILRSVNSILSQSLPDFEFIICNDGSNKNTTDVINKLNDSRIVVIENEHNIGLAASLNRCIERSRGKIIVRQDADDYSLPNRFSQIIPFFDDGYDIVSSNILLFDENGVWGKRDYPQFPSKNDFLFAIPFMHGACAIRKSAIVKTGLYSTEKVALRCEDYELFMRMYADGSKGVNLPQRLYAFQESKKTIKRRSYFEKIQQTKVKAIGFSQLRLYPRGLLYLPKPLIVGLIPQKLLVFLKNKYFNRKSI